MNKLPNHLIIDITNRTNKTMPDDVVIKVENLSKQYRIGAHEGYKTFRENLVDTVKVPFLRAQEAWSMAHRALSKKKSSALRATGSPLSFHDDTIWALKDVSFGNYRAK